MVGSLEAALPLARRAFLSPRTAFGFPFVLVATEGDGVLAQMSRFPGSAWRRLRVGTGVSMVLGGSPRAAWRLTWRGRVADRTMDPVPRDRLYVASLGVRADRRGQGIGGRLLAIACQEATASGLRAVALDVAASNERAIGFYLREGFAVVAERRHPATRGLPPGGAVRMERPAR